MGNHRGQKKVACYLSSVKEKNHQLKILYLVKISFGNEWGKEISSDKEKLRESAASRPNLKRLAKGRFPNRKDSIKEGISENQEGKKNNMKNKIKGKYNTFSLEFSKLCSIVEAKIIILCDAILNVCEGNI